MLNLYRWIKWRCTNPQKGNEKAMFKRTQEIRFYIWNLSIGTRTIKRDLVQGFWFRSCAQENLYKHLWATKQLKRTINWKFIPALPGYSGYRAGYSGPHCPECPGAVSGLKNQGCPESPGIYPGSPGTLSPNGYFWAEDYKYSLHTPSALSLATLTNRTQT